jgi:hypothetical protein
MPRSSCPDRTGIPSLSACEMLVGRRIRAACEAGHFDNLGGSGRSLRLCENLYVASGEDTHRVWHQIAHLNKRIAAFNMVAPLLQLQLPFLNVRRELQHCGVTDR